MRKIFTFFAAMMLSVTVANAAIETEDINWEIGDSTFTLGGWGQASQWSWQTGASNFEQVVVEVADHDYDIVLEVQFSDGTADHASKAIMRAGTNSVAVDVKQDILHAVIIQNFSENANVEITVKKLYFRKATGTIKTDSLLTTPVIFEDFKGWGEEIILDQTKFAKINAGDVLELNYTVDEQTYHQFKIQSSWLTYFPAFLGTLDAYNQYNIATDVHLTQVRFTILDDTDITNLKTQGGIHVNAKYLTLNSIVLYWHDDKATAIDEISQSHGQSQKFFKNGQLLILRENKIYTIQGQRIQ